MRAFKKVIDDGTYDMGEEYEEKPAYPSARATSHTPVKQAVDEHPNPKESGKEGEGIKFWKA